MLTPALPRNVIRRAAHMNLPVEFKAMVRAIETVTTMVEAKHLADKSEALALYCKMYESKDDVKAAARMRLTIYAKMGELAEELAGENKIKLLKSNGLTNPLAAAASLLAKLKRQAPVWNKVLDKAPTPLSAVVMMRNKSASEAYQILMTQGQSPFTSAMSFIRANSAKKLAMGVTIDEADGIRAKVIELAAWVDEFEQYLPAAPSGFVAKSRAQLAKPGKPIRSYAHKKAARGRPRGGSVAARRAARANGFTTV